MVVRISLEREIIFAYVDRMQSPLAPPPVQLLSEMYDDRTPMRDLKKFKESGFKKAFDEATMAMKDKEAFDDNVTNLQYQGFLHTEETKGSSPLVDRFNNLCRQRDLPRALEAMAVMHNNGFRADPITYVEAIKCCSSPRAAHLLHSHILSFYSSSSSSSSSFLPTFLFNSLLSMWLKLKHLPQALHLFHQIPHKDVVSWTTLISAFSSSSSPLLRPKASQTFILMLRNGILPNMFTFSALLKSSPSLLSLRLLHSFILRSGFSSDIFVRSATIDSYSKFSDLSSALSFFNHRPTSDPVVWNSIISGFAKNNHGDRAVRLYKRMKRRGIMGDQGALTSLLRACTGLSLLELGRQTHVHVLKFRTDTILSNAVLDMYCKCGSLGDAQLSFSRMPARERDVISWSTMISGLAQNGRSGEALSLFRGMEEDGREKPNHITILAILFACSHSGMVEEGRRLFWSMEHDYGIAHTKEHYGCMVDMLGRAGRLGEAMSMIEGMEPGWVDAVTWRALLCACRGHNDLQMGVVAAEKVLEMDPDDAGTLVMLSNMYAKLQRWDGVEQVRRRMDEMGIKKEAGCSWVEVGRKIHAFVWGDGSHPRMVEIEREVGVLLQKVAGVGYGGDTDVVLQDVEGEEKADCVMHHSEKLAIAFGLISLPMEKTLRVIKNLRMCSDCHEFAKLVALVEDRLIVVRDPVRYHHFRSGSCSCGDYW